jgi:small GTP-binding protein
MEAKKRVCVGLVAHVDAGKTTLSEAMLYCSGSLRTLGRVDHGDAFLDTFALERQRGITIFSKQALLTYENLQATLLDTPGHVDFSPETERTLAVLDCAILVISGTDGVQSHTLTLWRLLRQRNIPTFLFVSKMDLPGADRDQLLRDLQTSLDSRIFDLTAADQEDLALCDEALLSDLLEFGKISEAAIAAAIARGTLFPVWFGAALKLQGVEDLMQGLCRYAPACAGGEEFAAQVYKIARDAQGVRETHLKVTGGVLQVRQQLSGSGWSEKVTQLRVYSGAKFTTADAAYPGDIVAAVGLTRTLPGMGLGAQNQDAPPVLTPVLTYRVCLPEQCDISRGLSIFRQLEEEEPQLHVSFDEAHQEIQVGIMGPIQLEILQDLLETRYGLDVSFDQGRILYRETIRSTVEGVGHYEPLRHYAEVHLLMEPGEPGSGLEFSSTCSENDLDRNWQRLILTHLAEKTHLGVLTGAPITDMKITLAAGKAHLKHTEGGDFRQATYRAVRQGLMQAESVLLEPWYDFRLEVPQSCVGRAMTDLQRMGAELSPLEVLGENSLLVGSAPVAALRDYPQEITAYTHGLGRFSCTLRGYAPCQNQDAIVKESKYDPEADLPNTPDSVFCGHGAGYNVKWYEVPEHMHLPSVLKPPPAPEDETQVLGRRYRAMVATDKELLEIFERTYGPVRRDKTQALAQKRDTPKPYKAAPIPQGPEYVLVDGYNIIFAWESLKTLAAQSLDAARDRLIDIMRNYQSFRQCPVILVFDAYKVKGNPGSVTQFGDLSVVYTKEAQTADSYIERLSYDLAKKHRVRVATSDGLEQIIILGHGALRVSARAFELEVNGVMESIRSFLSE